MTQDTVTTFLSGYLHSLREESRSEKSGQKYGFDHVIWKLAEADGLVPLRLAFHRGGRKGGPRPKKEAEHGEDLKAMSRDGRLLNIYVLKDEPLTYRNWTAHNFDTDLRRAVSQDMRKPELSTVEAVNVILVYNKDEEARGVEAFERFQGSQSDRVGDRASLKIERWNITKLTEEVRAKLIGSPALLPEQFFSAFSYLCWQASDFSHGSEQGFDVLIPQWRKFLRDVLTAVSGERGIRMISVALLILQSHLKDHPASETAWIELIEWALLAVWKVAHPSKNKKVKLVAIGLCYDFYLPCLESYYERYAAQFGVRDSLACGIKSEFAEAVSTYHAYWHMARLGILCSSRMEMHRLFKKAEIKQAMQLSFHRMLKCWTGLINGNTACLRPLLDVHHLELFMFWRVMTAVGRRQEVLHFFAQIHERLVLRRMRNGGVPVIDQSNSWAQLLEFIATTEEPCESFGKSSYLLLMLIEICAGDLGSDGEQLASAFYKHLVLGETDEGSELDFPEKLELQSWIPPDDWVERVLTGYAGDSGICVSVHLESTWDKSTSPGKKVRAFVEEMRRSNPFKFPPGIPVGILLLACIRHRSPLPPEFWRAGFHRWDTQAGN